MLGRALRYFIIQENVSRSCIKLCVKYEIKWEMTVAMLTVTFGESTISRTQVQLRYIRFKKGREDVNDDARPDRPSTPTT